MTDYNIMSLKRVGTRNVLFVDYSTVHDIKVFLRIVLHQHNYGMTKLEQGCIEPPLVGRLREELLVLYSY